MAAGGVGEVVLPMVEVAIEALWQTPRGSVG